MSAILYFLSTVFAAGQSTLSKQYAVKGGNAGIYNINKVFAGMVTFLVFGIVIGINFHFPTFLYGACYGLLWCVSMYSGFKALALGPMTLTSVIASFSLIIPFLFGITLFHETVSGYNIIGIIMLLASIVLLTAKREKGFSVKWLLLALLTMLANGVCSLVQKFHQEAFCGEYTVEFTLSSFFAALVVLAIVQLFTANEGTRCKFTAYGFFAGIAEGLSNYITLYMAGTEKASVLFPMTSILRISAVWLAGRIIFKERLKSLQVLGLILGVASVILIKL